MVLRGGRRADGDWAGGLMFRRRRSLWARARTWRMYFRANCLLARASRLRLEADGCAAKAQALRLRADEMAMG